MICKPQKGTMEPLGKPMTQEPDTLNARVPKAETSTPDPEPQKRRARKLKRVSKSEELVLAFLLGSLYS